MQQVFSPKARLELEPAPPKEKPENGPGFTTSSGFLDTISSTGLGFTITGVPLKEKPPIVGFAASEVVDEAVVVLGAAPPNPKLELVVVVFDPKLKPEADVVVVPPKPAEL